MAGNLPAKFHGQWYRISRETDKSEAQAAGCPRSRF
jgi:hypothetical protein